MPRRKKSPDGVAKWLDRLEAALEPDWEREKLSRWRRVLDFEPLPAGGRFMVNACAPGGTEPGEWPSVGVNEACRSPERMLLHQLGDVYRGACSRSYGVPNIRCNYGTGILSSVFGAEMFWMEDSLDTLPTTRPLGGQDPAGRLLAAGAPDIASGLGARVFETAEYFKEAMRPYPKISEAVWIYHPDLQGPIDVCELLWGSDMYYAFYEAPEKVKALADLVTATYVRFMDRWLEVVPERDKTYTAHWGHLFKGHVVLRDDSIVNLSPEMYAAFVKPCDEYLLGRYGGGAIHFCGKGDHCIELMTDSPNLTAVNMSQPHLNDMRRIHAATVGRGKLLDCRYDEGSMAGLDLSRGVTLR